MRFKPLLLAGLMVFTVSSAQAALKDFKVQYQGAVVVDDRLVHETRRQNYGFRVEVVNDSEGVKPETDQNGRPFVAAVPGERYSVRLYNPLPVRVAVNLTVDGLNSITGQPSGIADGEKWMIEPYSSITIPGWQVSGGEARRFFFTEKPKSYAKWRGDETGEDLSANCGVIGAAYFWSQEELNQYYDSHPIYRYTKRPYLCPAPRAKTESKMMEAPASAAGEAMDLSAPESQPQAGTGMGERESNPTIQVAFDFDRGMYSPSQAVIIYYDFTKARSPNPFPAERYSPEMP